MATHYSTIKYVKRGTTGTETIAGATKANVTPEFAGAGKFRPANYEMHEVALASMVGGTIRVFTTEFADMQLHLSRIGTKEQLIIGFFESGAAGQITSEIAPTVMATSVENVEVPDKESFSGKITGYALVFDIIGQSATQTAQSAMTKRAGV